jgi:hypothetical protein
MLLARRPLVCLVLALASLVGAGAAHAQKARTDTIDDAVAATETCLASTARGYVDLGVLQGAGWKVTDTTGKPGSLQIHILDNDASLVRLMLAEAPARPGILQCNVVAHFNASAAFALVRDHLAQDLSARLASDEPGLASDGTKTRTSEWDTPTHHFKLQENDGNIAAIISVSHQ